MKNLFYSILLFVAALQPAATSAQILMGDMNHNGDLDVEDITLLIDGYLKDQKVWIDGHEYVDLGLSVNWATMNIGASTPEDYGDYFAWGETTPKNTYDMATYKWSNSVTSALTKYNTDPIIGIVDNITTLELLDDAANASWHGSWRMPTAAELTELMAKCTWTWTTQNGKNGYEVTGPNGNSIFLPAAGYYDENSLNEAGNAANYWSSSLETTHPNNGWYMSFGSKGVNMCDGVRCYGRSVRAVCKKTYIQPNISLSDTLLQMQPGESVQLTVTVEPSDAGIVTWTSSDESVATVANGLVTAIAEGTATIMAEVAGAKATCEVIVRDLYTGHEYVDLGLSVKWATMNIGANSPEECGDYFAWGETTPKDYYDWETTYKWCKWCLGTPITMTKYNYNASNGYVDNKWDLDPKDDAAHVNWGGTWRMPTYDECQELLDKCTTTWTSLNGVYGRKVTGPNGNSIFLPAAGCRAGNLLNNIGSLGSYWSNHLSISQSFYAVNVYFNSSLFGMNTDSASDNDRYVGRSVRAVCP